MAEVKDLDLIEDQLLGGSEESEDEASSMENDKEDAKKPKCVAAAAPPQSNICESETETAMEVELVDDVSSNPTEASAAVGESVNFRTIEEARKKRKREVTTSKQSEICTSTFRETDETTEEILSHLEDKYGEHRSLIVRKDGFISTPLHALKELAKKFQEKFHSEVMMLAGLGRKPLVRVELFVGAFRGVGESFYKRLSMQMAALDLLVKLKTCWPEDLKEVPFGIYPGWRIKPRVCPDLLDLCKSIRAKYPTYITKVNDVNSCPNTPLYTVECHIGPQMIAVGMSDLHHVARKLAAFYSIFELTGIISPKEYVAMGSSCLSYKQLVQQGYKPTLSELKKNWMLNEVDASLRHEDCGIDTDELAELKKDIQEEEAKRVSSNGPKKNLAAIFRIVNVNDVEEQQRKLNARRVRFG